MSEIKTTYRDIEIKYNEHHNNWMCDLFTQPANNLSSAKERIDKKLDAEKKKPFKRFRAFVQSLGYGSPSWPLVEVTSVTDNGKEVWCSNGGERKKIGGYSVQGPPVYPETPENSALIKEIKDHETAINNLKSKINKAIENLKIWEPEKHDNTV